MERIVIYMELCLGCEDIYIPEEEYHCDDCRYHVMHVVQEEETGGSE